MITIGTEIFSKRFGNVTVARIEDNKAFFVVDGNEFMVPMSLAKPATKSGVAKKSTAQKNREELARYNALPQHLRVFNALMTVAKMQHPAQINIDLYEQTANEIMSKVSNDMVASILTNTNPRKMTTNQAWAVAYACDQVEITNA